MTRSELVLRLAERAPRPFRGLFSLSGHGILPRALNRHWLAEALRERVPATRPDWVGDVVRLPNGMPIEVDVREAMGYQIARQGYWERDTVAFVRDFLRPGMTFFDVGANVGQYSLVASQCVGVQGRVHAFEPHPLVHRVLRRNLRRAGCRNAVTHQIALSESSGAATLFVQPHVELGGNSLRPTAWHPDAPGAPVKTITLDEYVRGANVAHTHLMKVDVEGAELQVLEGAKRTLDQQRDVVLIVEFLQRSASAFGHTVADLEAWLRARGFELFIVTLQGLVPYAPIADPDRYVNVVATRRRLDHLPHAAAGAGLLVQDGDGSIRIAQTAAPPPRRT